MNNGQILNGSSDSANQAEEQVEINTCSREVDSTGYPNGNRVRSKADGVVNDVSFSRKVVAKDSPSRFNGTSGDDEMGPTLGQQRLSH